MAEGCGFWWESEDRESAAGFYPVSPTFALLATFPGSLSDAVDPSILTPERARNRAMSRRIS
jgi:hypothetical protein